VTTAEWARTTISVFDEDGGIEETFDLPGESLEAQLVAAEAWLAARSPHVRSADGGVRLFCSWTPLEGRRAMTLPPSLVCALADAGGVFWLDAYPPEDAAHSAPDPSGNAAIR